MADAPKMIGESVAEQTLDSLLQVEPDLFKGTYSTADTPVVNFYIPALQRSCNYDRAAGYFSSRVLKVAARGLVGFIKNAQQHGGKMRLIVGAQLEPADVQAIREGTKSRQSAVKDAVYREDLSLSDDVIGDEYLRILGWMVREGLLEVKVGLPVDSDGLPLEPEVAQGYFHSKYGIFKDASGNKMAFTGSDNETAAGWIHNHETFVVAKSWKHEVWEEQGAELVLRFEAHWAGQPDQGWAVIDMSGVEDRLLTLISHDYEPPQNDPIWEELNPKDTDLFVSEDEQQQAADELAWVAEAPRRTRWTATGTAPVEPLPHQANLVQRVVDTYPRGYLFADEVGLGKTIETGLAIRELMLSNVAKKALLLVPASVMKQWQEELHEKIGLLVPRYVGSAGGRHMFKDLSDNEIFVETNCPWSAFPIVLASSHLARRRDRRKQIIESGPWDVVLVDEAHHARRRGSNPTDSPNSLLALLTEMKSNNSWNALYLATATPMQMNPHEAWDLINLLELPGRWGNSASDFVSYYEQIRNAPQERIWNLLSDMLKDYFSQKEAGRDNVLEAQIESELGLVKAKKIVNLHGNPIARETAAALTPREVEFVDVWLRRHTPMRDRVFRNTRETMRKYQAAGIIPEDVNIPYRHVEDVFIELNATERALYDRIEDYIRRHYNAYKSKQTQQALGFIMTIYRRRLTSSFEAIRCSLRRRLEVLDGGLALGELLSADDQYDVEDALFDQEEFESSSELLREEIQELRSFLNGLGNITGEDSKATQLIQDLNSAFQRYNSAVVFTQYTDTMDYVRERVLAAGMTSIGCYSGRGGEIFDEVERAWRSVTKSEIKDLFRQGQVRILIGTDSMSEGLNLQTCGRLINYDMPWNLMRVEQRIGRIDRIGSSHQHIQVSNYFYADTVEQRVYEGILEDYDDFTEIVGNAQPVLASVEDLIKQIALADDENQGGAIADAVSATKQQIESLNARPVQNADLGAVEIKEPPRLVGELTLGEIEAVLVNNALSRDRFAADIQREGVWLIDGTVEATFDRKVFDTSSDALVFLTYGNKLFESLLNSR